MLKWISWLTPKGERDSAIHKVEETLKELRNSMVRADHETKLACGQSVIEALRKLVDAVECAGIGEQASEQNKAQVVCAARRTAKRFG